MLSNRELTIIHTLMKTGTIGITTQDLAKQTKKSLRTTQQDLKNLKALLPSFGAQLKTSGRNTYLEIIDNNIFQEMLDDAFRQEFHSVDSQQNRIIYILKSLLTADSYIKSESFMDSLYASQSTINSDLKELRKILNKYQLELEHKPYYGLKLYGDEDRKRDCLIHEVMVPQNFIRNCDRETFKIISDLVSECFIANQYKIDDVSLLNLLMHIYTNMQRIIDGNYIQLNTAQEEQLKAYAHDVDMAQNILSKLSEAFQFAYPESEVYHLAVYIKGKRNLDNTDLITSDLNDKISEMLSYINKQCHLDLSYDIELRIALALHFMPLKVRLENKMQLKNPMLSDIKLNFTFAYELATIAGVFIRKNYGFLLNENELSYLAIHFNIALDKQVVLSSPKRILVLCSNRNSESLLLKHTLHKWFKEMILEMDVLNLHEINNEMISQYDVILTTVTDHESIPKSAIPIQYFLDEKDYQRIERALHYGNQQKQLSKFFNEHLFIPSLSCRSKEEAIREMCDLASLYKKTDIDLYDSVMTREQYGFTSFGNFVAIPHPNALISDETFAVSAILDQPITWGNQEVQLVFLICVEKESEKDLRSLFRTISDLLTDIECIQSIIQRRSFTFLMEQLSKN